MTAGLSEPARRRPLSLLVGQTGTGVDDTGVPAAGRGRKRLTDNGEAMNRRSFLSAVSLLTAPMASVAWAQPASLVYRIGFLESGPVTALTAPADGLLGALLGRLQELGYAEGRNLVLATL